MRDRILGLLGGRRRRSVLGATVAVVAAGVFAVSALAVHDLKFQLDGDVSASTTTNVGGSLQPFDWDSLFNASGNKITPLPSGFTAAAFKRDFQTNPNGSFDTSDSTTYATGSKDVLAITPGWQCSASNNVLSKNDIMNSYAPAFTNTNGDQIIYFALERNSNSGDANVGFWFLQDNTVDCNASGGGNTAFTGDHRDGDLLIVSAFTAGGTVSTIDVYRWNGGANGSLGTTSVAHGVDCKTTAGADTACATVNSPANGAGGTISTPWLTANKQDGVGHSLRTAEFFEGGLNLTKSNLGGKCFNEFISDTRSSQSLTATLFDFARGSIGECLSTTTTTPVDNSGNPIPAGGLTIPTDPADASILVKDKADISVTGVNSFTGTVSFHLCGPLPAASTSTCDTGGVNVGSKPVLANGTFTSDAATVTSAGRYCWRADFSGDTSVGVPSSSDSSATECFKVNPVTPTLTTQAGAGPVDFGQPVTDTATLSGTAHQPGTGGPSGSTDGSINPATLGGDAGGTITFTLYKDNSCSVQATGTGTNPQTVSVSGDGTYGPVSFTPDAPGTYHWVASYGGNLPNTTASDPSACLDTNEAVVVRQIPTEIKTKQSWVPNDTATVSATIGNLGANGSVQFSLYDNGTCSGTALFSETKSISGGSPTETVSTNNTSFTITTGFNDLANTVAGPYSWKVVYTPAAGDTAHTGKQSSCDAERFGITYSNDPGPGSNLP